MRDFVANISQYCRACDPDFIIIPQNGHELLSENSLEDGTPDTCYIKSIDGVGREDLFYGYAGDNTATPTSEREIMIAFMNLAENNGIEVLVTDYCWDHDKMDDSYEQSHSRGYISFAADHRALDDIPDYPPDPYNMNSNSILELSQGRNFLYLINDAQFSTKNDMIDALAATDYDLLIIDLFFGATSLDSIDLAALKNKNGGGLRLLIAYMSIGEAENYRYYWDPEWDTEPPSWLDDENPEWPGNYRVRYWESEWQDIICGSDSSYAGRIINAGFDGVYLDIIDGYEYYE